MDLVLLQLERIDKQTNSGGTAASNALVLLLILSKVESQSQCSTTKSFN